MKNICLVCNEFKELALFQGELLCCDCLAEKAVDLHIKTHIPKRADLEELQSDAVKILDFYGDKNQLGKAIEEVSELTIELVTFLMTGKIPDNLISEIADVKNMILQVEIMIGVKGYEVLKIRADKNKRTLNSIAKL